MSKSIDNVRVQIPGTMYYLQLAEDRGRWVLSLLLRGDVESEVIVPVFSKNGINKSANELLNNSRLVIDKYPLRNVCDQLFSAAETNLPTSAPQPNEERADIVDLEELKQKIDLLENTLENESEELKENISSITERLSSLENDRVARIETELHKDEAKSDEEIYTKIFERLDKLEEDHAETKGDERVPSILTAIDALESKVSQLEGATVTGANSNHLEQPIEFDFDVVSLKEELGKLSKAFDLINQRLTDIELKLKAVAPPTTFEGESEPKPPEV
ncbi:MAG TPA: hypothetical protein VMX55_02405 [candidate division Zixibacteria bacterium]|nr:hypothetical protein [candidate division Zixibacteria bacterium]